eukprot:57275-Chlamydomonas_euryale.AAC.1
MRAACTSVPLVPPAVDACRLCVRLSQAQRRIADVERDANAVRDALDQRMRALAEALRGLQVLTERGTDGGAAEEGGGASGAVGGAAAAAAAAVADARSAVLERRLSEVEDTVQRLETDLIDEAAAAADAAALVYD